MNRKITKLLSAAICSALCVSGIGAIYALGDNKADAPKAVIAAAVNTANSDEENEVTKDETVYVLAGADGSVKKIIVSDWIKNALNAGTLNDSSELNDIENVKGDESYTVNGDNAKIWDAQGNDIYYQGNIDKEVPVGLKISYFLDGKQVSADEIAGKSGKVTIRFDYDNHQYEMVEIDGKEEKIYVPFAMLTGTILDNDVFRNVEVSNGKLINDGNRTVVIGVALPGMQENLALTEKTDLIPDHFEITADVTNFSFGMTVTVATNELFNKVELGSLESADSLKDAVSKITDAMTQLTDGSSALYDGLCTLLEKSGTLADGIDQLTDGALALRDGAVTLDDGAAQIKAGTKELSTGLNTLAANNDTLTGGAKQVFETLLATANTQIAAAGLDAPALTIANYGQVLDGVVASLTEDNVKAQALEKVTAAVEANRPLIVEKVTAAVREQVEPKVIEAVQAEVEKKVNEAVQAQVTEQVTAAVREQVEAKVTAAVQAEVEKAVNEAVKAQVTEQVIAAAAGMTKKDFDAACAAGLVDAKTKAGVEAAVEAQMGTAEVKALVQSNTEAQMATKDVKNTVKSNTDAQMKTKEVKATIKSNVDAQMKTDAVKAIIKTNVDAQMETKEIKATIKSNTDAQMKTADIKKTIADNVEVQVKKAIDDNMASDEVKSQIAAALEGAKTLAALKTSLDSYNTFYEGIKTYTAGVATAATGAATLDSGMADLKAGTEQIKTGIGDLYDGASQINDNMPALTDGITQLRDGSKQIADGLTQFNSEAIDKIVSLLDGDLAKSAERLKATIDVSKNYNNFSGIDTEMDGQVKFFYRTDEIKAE